MSPETDSGDDPLFPDRPSLGRSASGGPLTPHDSVFRRVLGVPENMASQLRAVLPPEIAGRLDLGRLARVQGSFVDESLKWRHSDLLFSAPLDGKDTFVYVLVEHQSSTDEHMVFRLLRYVIRIWSAYLDEHPRSSRLPAVIPLVVHHGRGRWNSPLQMLDLIDLDPDEKKAMEAYLPRFEYLIDDLADVDSSQLRGRKLTPQALITLQVLRTAAGRLLEELRRWKGDLRAALDQAGGGDAFIAILTYVETISDVPDSDLRDLAASLGPDAEEAYMTIAEQFRAEGEAKGEAKSVLRNLKNRGIPVDAHSRSRIIACTDVETLDTWLDRSLAIANVTDLFAS